jgi:hypothetical protein
MEAYSVDELAGEVLNFGLLKVAILSLTLKVVIMEDVLNSTLYGLSIYE